VEMRREREIAAVFFSFFISAMIFSVHIGVARAYDSSGAPHLFLHHTTRSWLVKGRSDYDPAVPGMSPPAFQYVYLDVAPLSEREAGVISLDVTSPAMIVFYDDEGFYTEPESFSGGRLLLESHLETNPGADAFCVVDESGNHAEFYQGSEEAFSKGRFSISFGDGVVDGAFTRLHSTSMQMEGRCVPYVELVERNLRTTGLIWRFADPADPSYPAVSEGRISEISVVKGIMIRMVDGEIAHEEEINFEPVPGRPIEGRVTLPAPIDWSRVSYIRITFDYGDNIGRSLRTDYSWRFYTENGAVIPPSEEDEDESEDAEGLQ
jgi:hypothetical protein